MGKIRLKKGNVEFEAEYIGRYDFLYLYNMKLISFPFVGTISNKSCAFINVELLNKHGFSLEEMKAILWHEVGHQISRKQEVLEGIEKEFDADNYAISKCDAQTVISALQKSIKMINEIGNEKSKKKGIKEIESRIEQINRNISQQIEDEK